MNNLETRIQDELTAIDIDSRYDDMLDDVYPDLEIAGMSFCTSHALKKLDPTAYRCGLSDWLDSENFVEINGDYYEADDCERIKDEMISEIECQMEQLGEENIQETDSSIEEQREIDQELIDNNNAEILNLQKELKKLKGHCF